MSQNDQATTSGSAIPDFSKGVYVPAVPVSANEATAVMPVQQLLSIVPDPILSEDPKRVASDPILAQYWEIRKEVQRMVTGAKLKNAESYKRYLVEGLSGRRPTMVPPITLYHPKTLESSTIGSGVVALCIPFGDFMVAIDGETQRIAWQMAAKEHPDALGRRVKVVIHHGKAIEEARQGFYDMNTLEVKPTAAVSISMDTQDVASRLARRVMEASEVLRDRVNLHRRQLRARDPEVLTISALRTGIVTTILGPSGLQAGMRPIGEMIPQGTDIPALEQNVLEIWCGIAEVLEDELAPDRRSQSVVSAPAILAGIGIVAHHAMPAPPRKNDDKPSNAEWSIDDVLDVLRDVNWDRESPKGSVWEGVAGKVSASGFLSIGGPKEVGYAVAEAVGDRASKAFARVRASRSPRAASK